jgi:hypothetical protein
MGLDLDQAQRPIRRLAQPEAEQAQGQG